MNSYMQNMKSLPLTDHVNCASFLASIFLVYVEPKLFFSLLREKSVTADGQKYDAVRKIRSIRNCTVHT